MPRFVILEHDHPQLHWDLLLEAGQALKAWRLSRPPTSGASTDAAANFDHRLLYLDYEGPVSDDRGSVRQWDAGTFEWIERGEDRIVVALSGNRVQGRAHLTKESTERWTFSFGQPAR